MESLVTKYVLIDSLLPLKIHSYDTNIVSFIQGPHFVKHWANPEESMYYSTFLKILKDRKYKDHSINNITNHMNLTIMLAIVSVWETLVETYYENSG